MRIAVGDELEDVSQRIASAGGRDISRFVGVITYPHSRWFVLKDGTALRVQAAALDGAGSGVVGRLTVGEIGRGYENGQRWEHQRTRDVRALDL